MERTANPNLDKIRSFIDGREVHVIGVSEKVLLYTEAFAESYNHEERLYVVDIKTDEILMCISLTNEEQLETYINIKDISWINTW